MTYQDRKTPVPAYLVSSWGEEDDISSLVLPFGPLADIHVPFED
jgi:hypothetical protein